MPLLRRFSNYWFLYLALTLTLPCWAADWPPLAPDDMKMTDLPQQKGAPAVILLREEVADDLNNFHSVYMRVKILTDAGREYADVHIPYGHRFFKIDSISGRTVHPDGTVINFDGKVFDKMVVKRRVGRNGDYRVHVKSFSLPDVQVGSIIDYRYSLRYQDHTAFAPDWEVQSDLFQEKATFKFIPYVGDLVLAHNQVGNGIQWTSYLPVKGPQPKFTKLPTSVLQSTHSVQEYVDLSLNDIPPLQDEPFMPPPGMLRYRVNFYYMLSVKQGEFWKEEGKYWSKDVEKFLDRKDGVADTVSKITSPSDTPEQKVRKIYAFVSGLENQSYRPKREQQEEKVIGLRGNEGAEDVLRQKSGDHDDLNRLFAAMVRAAGIPAEMMWVASREQTFFLPDLLDTRQLDAEIAIVRLGDKDLFLDPGTKYCPFGLLDWRYSGTRGLRETGGKSTDIVEAPLPEYSQAMIQRLARLEMNDEGRGEGTIKIGYYGLEAMERRQKAANTDEEGKKKLLEDEVKRWLPGDSEVHLQGTPNWDETETHLAAEFKISSPLATSAGKRWLLPAHIFQVNQKPVFSASQRINPIYFWYPTREIDEVHVKLPAGVEVESMPPNDSVKLDYAVYTTKQKQEGANAIMAYRDLAMAGIAFQATEYPRLKTFYDQTKAGDDQQVILHGAAHAAVQ